MYVQVYCVVVVLVTAIYIYVQLGDQMTSPFNVHLRPPNCKIKGCANNLLLTISNMLYSQADFILSALIHRFEVRYTVTVKADTLVTEFAAKNLNGT